MQSMQLKHASNRIFCQTSGNELLVHMQKVKQTQACLDHARSQSLRQRMAAASQPHASSNDSQHSLEVEADESHEHNHSMPTTKTATSAIDSKDTASKRRASESLHIDQETTDRPNSAASGTGDTQELPPENDKESKKNTLSSKTFIYGTPPKKRRWR